MSLCLMSQVWPKQDFAKRSKHSWILSRLTWLSWSTGTLKDQHFQANSSQTLASKRVLLFFKLTRIILFTMEDIGKILKFYHCWSPLKPQRPVLLLRLWWLTTSNMVLMDKLNQLTWPMEKFGTLRISSHSLLSTLWLTALIRLQIVSTMIVKKI